MELQDNTTGHTTGHTTMNRHWRPGCIAIDNTTGHTAMHWEICIVWGGGGSQLPAYQDSIHRIEELLDFIRRPVEGDGSRSHS